MVAEMWKFYPMKNNLHGEDKSKVRMRSHPLLIMKTKVRSIPHRRERGTECAEPGGTEQSHEEQDKSKKDEYHPVLSLKTAKPCDNHLSHPALQNINHAGARSQTVRD